MHIIELENMGGYTNILEEVIEGGVTRRPRGILTRDIGPTTIVINDPRKGMPLGIGRSLNPSIGAVEAAQLIAGIATPALVLHIAPQFASYLENDKESFHGSYGDRIGFQANSVVQKLRHDANTRQAVITLWDPWLDNLEGKHDYPCTVALQFAIVQHHLEMTTIMRSNDAWLGFPYDVFQFTQLQMTIANTLGVNYGAYRHIALSFHIYEENLQNAHKLINYYDENEKKCFEKYYETFQPSGVGAASRAYSLTMKRMVNLLHNHELQLESVNEEWYRGKLHKAS